MAAAGRIAQWRRLAVLRLQGKRIAERTAPRGRRFSQRGGANSLKETWRYLGSRIVTTALVLIGALVLLFSLTAFVPGNAARVLLGPRASEAAVAELRVRMGLDLP